MPAEWSATLLTAGQVIGNSVLFLALVQNGLYLLQVALAFFELRRTQRLQHQFSAQWLLGTKPVPGISILVPAYNEEVTIVENIRSLLTLRYPRFQIIVVNDGSKDRTATQVIAAFDLKPVEVTRPAIVPHQPVRGIYRNRAYPDLIFIDKHNGGKSDALNAALTFAEHPLVCAVDADSVLDHNSLLLAARPFLEEPDAMIAVGGTIRIANGSTIHNGTVVAEGAPRRLLPLFQAIEYFRSFLLARLAFSRLDAVAIVSGAFGLFKRSAVVQVGGYSTNTVGEDMELIVRLHRFFRDNGRHYSIRFLPDAVCWTEAPDTVKVLRRQRTRWQRGLCETLWTHRRMLFNARYGRIGFLSLPQFVVFDIAAPLLETAGLVLMPLFFLMGMIRFEFLIAYFVVVSLFGVFCSMISLVLAEAAFFKTTRRRDMVLYGLAAFGENLGYRQLNALWRIEGIWQFFRGRRGWGEMTRKGFAKANPVGAAENLGSAATIRPAATPGEA
jgi:cellulose synthase/poly-beta-1,6-N-acetylglucosamine synthase-like glycosyltransferase